MRYHEEPRINISPKALRVALAAADMSRRALARKLGVHPITAFRWAHGLNRVSVATVRRMEKLLGAPEGALTDGGA